MCGIVGFLGGAQSLETAPTLDRMANCIVHRGPDSSGTWFDPEAGIALGHRRLAIVDLSLAGHQPMHSASGRYVIVYNGEIYNHLEVRAELNDCGNGPQWRGHSDTETLLAAIERWGVAEALGRCIGMFAFALWDRERRILTLARDRLGEKPLYYGWQGSGRNRTFLFGSELKPLAGHRAFEGAIDREALTSFMRFGYIPAPRSIYVGISKLEPGSIATVEVSGKDPEITRYWSAAAAIEEGRRNPYEGDANAAVADLDALLADAVGKQMMSDVPLGAFLSGGIDSSTVVSLMQAQSSRPVKTFSIGFHEEGYDEAQHAKAVARHLGTDHTEHYVSAAEALAVIPELPAMYDEPFADASQIPTFLVSRLARSKVTVSLSGDAGDELFAGYNRYLMTDRLWGRLKSAPRPLRAALASGLTGVSPAAWNAFTKQAGRFVPALGRIANPGHRIHKGAAVLASPSLEALYRGITSHWLEPGKIVLQGAESGAAALRGAPAGLSDVEKMMAADLVTYLPDDILVKVDRAAMAVSLESRVPFLDHRVVEFAWRLPMAMKLRGGTSKWCLRQVLHRYVPQDLVERPKMGFGLPIDSWLRGPLRDWAEDLLDEKRMREQGFLEPKPIRQLWETHLSGRADVQYPLWDVLMFQAWLASHGEIRLRDREPDAAKIGSLASAAAAK